MRKKQGSKGLGKNLWKRDSHSGINAVINVSILNLTFLLVFNIQKENFGPEIAEEHCVGPFLQNSQHL